MPSSKVLKSVAEVVQEAIKKADKAPTKGASKASEALGKMEGKTLMVTESDRTKVGQGYLGGPGFSSLQLTDPAYRDVGAVWGVAVPGKATTMLNASRRVPEGQHVFTTMVGSPTQHRSNQQVFNKLLDEFRASAREGNLSEELRGRINDSLRAAITKKGKPIFAPDADIMSPKFRKQANTFERRAIAADLIAGEGLGGKKGQIIDFEKLMRRTTDPLLMDVETGSMGPRLFTLSGETIQRPDLHPAFPSILTGEDLGVAFEPVPVELMFRDYVRSLMETKGRKPEYFNFTRGYGPSQFISEDFLTEMQKAGYAEGGAVMMNTGGNPDVTDSGRIDLNAQYELANGGAVMMADGGDPESPTLREMGQPRYSTERKGTNVFKFTKDVLENLYQMAKMQAAEELKTTDPRAITDVANNIIADTVGAPVDMVNMAMQSFGVGSERPVGGSQQVRDLMREYEMTSGVERPLTETLLSIAGPGAVAKGPRAAERALNVGTAAVRRPFTPVTVTTEAVAPDLAKTQDEAFKQYVTKQLLGEGDVKTLGGRPVTQRSGQGVYYNEAGQLELNPMVGLDVPVRGSLAKAEKFKGDVATLGAGLGQEAMAAHRFIPMATNQIKDATAMLIKGPEGKSLTREQVIELGQDLPGMIVTHSPRLGGVMVAPFSITKGVIPPEFLEAQSRAKKLFGKGVTIQYGRADPGKDLMYMSRDEYAMSGAREPSVEMQRKRAQLKRMEQSLPAGRRSAVATQSQSPAVLDKTD